LQIAFSRKWGYGRACQPASCLGQLKGEEGAAIGHWRSVKGGIRRGRTDGRRAEDSESNRRIGADVEALGKKGGGKGEQIAVSAIEGGGEGREGTGGMNSRHDHDESCEGGSQKGQSGTT